MKVFDVMADGVTTVNAYDNCRPAVRLARVSAVYFIPLSWAWDRSCSLSTVQELGLRDPG